MRDQRERPTCLAHAATTAHQGARVETDELSPEYLHFFSTGCAPGNDASFAATAKALDEQGQPLEADCPYHVVTPVPSWAPDSTVATYHRASEPKPAEPDEVEGLLRSGSTVVLGIAIPDPFFDVRSPWIVSASGPVRGLHAVVAVGLGSEKARRLFLIRNSWGTLWGDAGHAWLDDSFLGAHLREAMVLTHEVAP